MTEKKQAKLKAQINKRVSARYDFLMERGKHGHYETMYKCVHEELALATTEAKQVIAMLVEALESIVSEDTMMIKFQNGVKAPEHGKCAKIAYKALDTAHAYLEGK